MWVTTEVINNSDRELVLKEGNTGTYRKLATLEVSGPKCKFRIKCNTGATAREFWVGTGVKDVDKSKIIINSDDCVECETIYIKTDPNNFTKLKLDSIKRGTVTELVNQIDGVAKLKTRLKDGSEEQQIEIPRNEKVLLQPGSKEYSVVLESGRIISITKKQVAKNQRIDINTNSGSQQDAKLDMVMRGLYLTEVTNRSSDAIQVKHLIGSGGAATVLATLQTDGKYTIQCDPKKKDHKYSVEYASAAAGPHVLDLTSSDFADFVTIDVIDGEPAGAKALQRLQPRPSADKFKDGILSRFLGWIGFKA